MRHREADPTLPSALRRLLLGGVGTKPGDSRRRHADIPPYPRPAEKEAGKEGCQRQSRVEKDELRRRPGQPASLLRRQIQDKQRHRDGGGEKDLLHRKKEAHLVQGARHGEIPTALGVDRRRKRRDMPVLRGGSVEGRSARRLRFLRHQVHGRGSRHPRLRFRPQARLRDRVRALEGQPRGVFQTRRSDRRRSDIRLLHGGSAYGGRRSRGGLCHGSRRRSRQPPSPFSP